MVDSPPLRGANDRSRWCTVWSLVERNTYQIDEIRKRPGWATIDMVRHDGHFYSSKPPLLPRLVAEVYRAIKWATGWNLLDHTRTVTCLILFLVNILPMGLAWWVFVRWVGRAAPGIFPQVFLLVVACWGTLLTPFLTVFNNHTPAAVCFFLGLPLADSLLRGGGGRSWKFAACGLLTAFGVCNELPAALWGLILFGLLLRAAPKQTLMWFVPAALIPLAGFFWTNYSATGGLKPFYAFYGTEKYVFVHEGEPSYWAEPRGIDQALDSFGTYLFHCTIGHHGILSLTPVLLLTLLAWLLPGTWRRGPQRVWAATSLVLTTIVLAFYLSKTANYNYGGVSVALRWTLWLTPFWLATLVPVVAGWGDRRPLRGFAGVLLAFSVFSAWYPLVGPWTKPWIYQWLEHTGRIKYPDPRPAFARPHYSWISELPTGELDPDYWIELTALDVDGSKDVIRLADAGPAQRGDLQTRRISYTHSRNGESRVETVFEVDPVQFAAGAPVSDFLIGSEDRGVDPEQVALLQTLPVSKPLASSRIRYERTRLRTDAFRCHIGYATMPAPGNDLPARLLARDVWFAEELPFGVLQREDRVLELPGRALASRTLWKATAMGRELPRRSTLPTPPRNDPHGTAP